MDARLTDGPLRGATGSPSSPSRGLRWRIKDSFVGYVLGRAGGRYRLDGGAELLPDRYFAFPFAEDQDPALARFTGSVGFQAHGGMLQLAIVNPALRRSSENGLELTVDIGDEAVAIARIGDPGPDGDWTGFVPRLTAEGRTFFGDAYEIGEPLDPLMRWDGPSRP